LPCKTFLFVFLSGAKIRANSKFCPTPKAKGSRMHLVTAEHHGLLRLEALRHVAERSNQGRNDERARGTIPQAPNHYEEAE